MSDWYEIEVEFTGRQPTAEELEKLREVLAFDGVDMPELLQEGMLGRWRKPPADVDVGCVADVLAFCGFPARVRSRIAGDWRPGDAPRLDDEPWREGRSTLGGLPEWVVLQMARPLVEGGFAELASKRRGG